MILFSGVIIGAAILIYRNIRKTPRNNDDDSNFSNATGRAGLTSKPKRYNVMTTSERMHINSSASMGMFKRGVCPPQCD